MGGYNVSNYPPYYHQVHSYSKDCFLPAFRHVSTELHPWLYGSDEYHTFIPATKLQDIIQLVNRSDNHK